jgi:hypothetical protein
MSEKLTGRITAAIMVTLGLLSVRSDAPTSIVLAASLVILGLMTFITGEAGPNKYGVAIITGAAAGLLMLANLPVRALLAVMHADAGTRAAALADWTMPGYGAVWLVMALGSVVAAYGPRLWGSDAPHYGFRAGVFAAAGLLLLSHVPLRLALAVAPPAARAPIAAQDWSMPLGVILLILACVCWLFRGRAHAEHNVPPFSDRTVQRWYGTALAVVGVLMFFKVPIWIVVYLAPANERAGFADAVREFTSPMITAVCVTFIITGVAVWAWATYRKAA